MKPIIISVAEEKDGYIRLKKEDLEKYINEAYQSGLRDGSPYVLDLPLSPLISNEPTCRQKSSTKPIEITWIGVD